MGGPPGDARGDGHELKDVASALGVTLPTARQYMGQVLRKTGTNRRRDLARLLVSLGMQGADAPPIPPPA